METVEAWSFLVSRNQYIDYRVVVAPNFLCETDTSSILAQFVEGNLTQPGTVLYQEVRGTIVGDLTLIYRVVEATAEDTKIQGSRVLKDAFGREICLIEGIVLKGILPDFVLGQEALERAHQELLEHYRSFWEVTNPTPAIPSSSFKLQSQEKSENGLKSIKIQSSLDRSRDSEFATSDDRLNQMLSWQLVCEQKFEREITSLAISPQADFLALRCGHEILIWSLSEKKILKKFSGLEAVPLSGHPTPVVLDPTGQFLTSAELDTGERNIIKIWDLKSPDTKGKNLGGYGSFVKMGVTLFKSFFQEEKTSSRVRAVAFSPDSQMVIVGCGDGSIQFWDAKEEGIELGMLSGHSSEITCLAVDLKNVILASGDSQGLISIWSLRNRQRLRTIQGHKNSIKSIAFSPVSQIFATSSDDYHIKIWDGKTGQAYEGIDWKQTTTANSLAFSPDGKLVASGSEDGKITLWDLKTKEVALELLAHNQAVTALVFSSEGSLLSSSKDRTVKVWQQT